MSAFKPMPMLAAGGVLAAIIAATLPAQDKKSSGSPLKVLLITGGCCHDYAAQKDILKKGLEARINAVVDQVHSDDKSTKPPLAILGNPDYAKGYDLVIHDECAADVKDPAVVEGVLAPHKAGIPGVNLHCAMHCYRVGNVGKAMTPGSPEAMWFDYLGLQSSGHGPQEPITISFTDKAHPAVAGQKDWVTMKEELYNNIAVFPTAKPLANGTQVVKKGDQEKSTTTVVAWTNTYGPKNTRVYSTTIGHNNATVEDARYLDMVAQGVLWAAGRVDDKGQPLPGAAKAVAK